MTLAQLQADVAHRRTLTRLNRFDVQDCLSALVDYSQCKWVPARISTIGDVIRSFLGFKGYLVEKHNKVTVTAKGFAALGRSVEVAA